MSVKKIFQIGNKVIRTKAKKVVSFNNASIKKTMKDLVDSMRKYELVGIAAPQIGKSTRIIVTELRKTEYRKKPSDLDKMRVFINPTILSKSKKQVIDYEGCGSVANAMIFGPVKRSYSVTVSARDICGDKFTLNAKGLLARVIQHEIDHLDGITFINHVSDTRKLKSKDEYMKSA
jgi:peptide deformylase